MQHKVTALKVCDVQESRSLQDSGTKRYLNITILIHMELDGKPTHKTLDLLPGTMYEIESLIKQR
jgi:hypothetical protein